MPNQYSIEARGGLAEVQLSSPGGSVVEALGIFGSLRQHPARVRVDIVGAALSAASAIAMAGDHVTLVDGGLMMLHNPHADGLGGEAGDLRKVAEIMDRMKGSLVSAYSRRLKMPTDEIEALLDRCLDDPSIDAKDAGQLLLKALGRGPIGDYHNIRTSGDDLIEFKAAATDALLAREGIRVEKPHAAARDLSRMSVAGMAETFLKQRGVSTAA